MAERPNIANPDVDTQKVRASTSHSKADRTIVISGKPKKGPVDISGVQADIAAFNPLPGGRLPRRFSR